MGPSRFPSSRIVVRPAEWGTAASGAQRGTGSWRFEGSSTSRAGGGLRESGRSVQMGGGDEQPDRLMAQQVAETSGRRLFMAA